MKSLSGNTIFALKLLQCEWFRRGMWILRLWISRYWSSRDSNQSDRKWEQMYSFLMFSIPFFSFQHLCKMTSISKLWKVFRKCRASSLITDFFFCKMKDLWHVSSCFLYGFGLFGLIEKYRNKQESILYNIAIVVV